MGLPSYRYKTRKAAKQSLESIISHEKNVVIIHYSCESFYHRPDGSSPRITSIAVRNLGTGQTTSFSIHQVAERDGVDRSQIEQQYNRLERLMLDDFYQYVTSHLSHTWLHWNMRDINYGFAAIAHRYRVLGGSPAEIHETNMCDLAGLLIRLYGPSYAGHPRLTSLLRINSISEKDFLTGQQEADAFVNRDYVRLHQSTLRKVDVLNNIFVRLSSGTLKVKSNWKDVHGSVIWYCAEVIQEHPLFVIIGFVSSGLGIYAFFFTK